jgi:hypothetical protein
MKDYILKNGLLLGAFLVLLSIISYLFGVDFKLSFAWTLIEIFAPFFLLIFLLLGYKQMNQGFLTYGHAFIVCFGLFATSSFIHTFFKVLLFNYIDPSFSVMLQEGTIQKFIEIMSDVFPPDALETMITELETHDNFSVTNLTKGFTSMLFIYAFLSLLIAVFIKKDPPLEIE